MDATGTPLARDTRRRNAQLLAGSLLVAGATPWVMLVPSLGVAAGMGAAVLGVSGVTMLGNAMLAFSAKGACPRCGAAMTRLPKNAPAVACGACGRYAIVERGRVLATPDDHVTSPPAYAVAVARGEHPPFPRLCVGCGRDATVRIAFALSKRDAGELLEWIVAPAFCAEHATLDAAGLPHGIVARDGGLLIGSHRVWLVLRGRAAA